jgi:hypothetical protein
VDQAIDVGVEVFAGAEESLRAERLGEARDETPRLVRHRAEVDGETHAEES